MLVGSYRNTHAVLVLAGAFVSLASCSSNVAKTGVKDRMAPHRITCRNMVTNCYVTAGRVCNGDYDVVSKVEVMKTSGTSDGYREFDVLYRCL